MIYIIAIESFDQLPILCGLPHAIVAVFCYIYFFRYFKWGINVNFCQILSPEIRIHLQLGSSEPSISGRSHDVVFFW